MKRRDFIKVGLTTLAAAPVFGAFPGGVSRAFATGKQTLKIGYLPITDHLLMIAAQQHRFEHIKLEPIKFSSWPEAAEALRAGAVDGAFLLTPIGLTLRRNGAPIKAVLLGHRNGSVITVRNGNDINSISDLKGKTIAIPSPFSTHNLLLRKVLTENGLIPDSDVRLLDMAPPEMVMALATRRIDGFIVAEPFGAQAEAQQVGKVLTLSKDIWNDHICCVLNLRENIINQPEIAQDLVLGLIQTANFIQSEPDEAAQLSVRLLGQRPEIIKTVLTTPKGRITFDSLAPTVADFAATQNYMLQFGVAREQVDLDQYLDARFALNA
ncbi:MAG: ABC transporter substrate-binding protein [Desulfuromonadales bacterium]|nr:ABC transporter substrate-binding protein [Desulfuromonadales bacterium]